MRYRKEVTLKTGERCLLRSLCVQDAQETLAVCRKSAGETLNMMRYEDEWTMTAEQEAAFIEKQRSSAQALMLGAFVDGKLAGTSVFQSVHPGDRARHRAGVGISILRAYWGRGIGRQMMQAMIEAAKTTPLEQLELSVVADNTRAYALYRSLGFEEYGRHRRAMKYRNGAYADLILMALDLQNKPAQ